MKRLIPILFILCFICLRGSYAQSSLEVTEIAPTTEEEYNYLTKGYKIQVESGLDMKKGYSLVDLSPSKGWSISFNEGSIVRSIKYKALVRDGETKPCAILCIMERKDTGYSSYWCIPSSNAPKELWNKLFNDIDKESEVWKDVHIWALSKLVSTLSYVINEQVEVFAENRLRLGMELDRCQLAVVS